MEAVDKVPVFTISAEILEKRREANLAEDKANRSMIRRVQKEEDLEQLKHANKIELKEKETSLEQLKHANEMEAKNADIRLTKLRIKELRLRERLESNAQ